MLVVNGIGIEKMRYISLVCILIITCCDNDVPQISTNDSSLEGMSFREALNHISDSDPFKNCDVEGLEPLAKVWSPPPRIRDQYADYFADATGEELALKVIEFSENLDIEIAPRARDQITMFQFKIAAEQNSSIAMNEIGSSLLHCYQHVEQNLEDALWWLEKAASNGDDYAMRSIANMHLLGMTDVAQPRRMARELLIRCAKLGNEDCVADVFEMTADE